MERQELDVVVARAGGCRVLDGVTNWVSVDFEGGRGRREVGQLFVELELASTAAGKVFR